ncbi:MAG TPA: polysaccharide deacetylase family protein [Bryobacteraceae bacterium]|nr:polysaccharide deacetylase family protein [Bryobacteraceae bacterium]
MGFISLITRLAASSLLLAAAGEKTLYLTIDTGSMGPAEEIAQLLRKHKVKATFFVANEKTTRGDMSMDASWAPFWKSLVADGHAFGSHTFRHWYFRKDLPGGKVAYIGKGGQRENLDRAGVCRELKHSEDVFRSLTGRGYDAIWRAPGGKTTPFTLKSASSCGYKEHIGWPPAGFLGDELPSDRYPNATLLRNAVRDLRDGDILVMHLGIWSRKDPFWPMLDPLLTQLKAKGFVFKTIPERRQK